MLIHGFAPMITYTAGIAACERGVEWEHVCSLLSELWDAKLEPPVFSYRAVFSACEQCGEWQQSLPLLNDLRSAKI